MCSVIAVAGLSSVEDALGHVLAKARPLDTEEVALADAAFGALGVPKTPWAGHGGFDTLLRSSAPAFWFFFLMTGISLFVLRFRDRHIERPFRVPLFPLTPVVFCGTSGWMFVSSVEYAGRLVVLTIPFLLLGIPFYFTRREASRASLPKRVTVETLP